MMDYPVVHEASGALALADTMGVFLAFNSSVIIRKGVHRKVDRYYRLSLGSQKVFQQVSSPIRIKRLTL